MYALRHSGADWKGAIDAATASVNPAAEEARYQHLFSFRHLNSLQFAEK
jgi:hypothetical protein